MLIKPPISQDEFSNIPTLVFRISIKQIKPYDVALLKLKTPLVFNERVQAISLPSLDVDLPVGNANVTGWGSVSNGFIPKPPKVLQVAEVSLLSLDNCASALKAVAPTEGIFPGQLCSGPLDAPVSACIVSIWCR